MMANICIYIQNRVKKMNLKTKITYQQKEEYKLHNQYEKKSGLNAN